MAVSPRWQLNVSLCFILLYIYWSLEGYIWLILPEYSGLQAGSFKLYLTLWWHWFRVSISFSLVCMICCFSFGQTNFLNPFVCMNLIQKHFWVEYTSNQIWCISLSRNIVKHWLYTLDVPVPVSLQREVWFYYFANVAWGRSLLIYLFPSLASFLYTLHLLYCSIVLHRIVNIHKKDLDYCKIYNFCFQNSSFLFIYLFIFWRFSWFMICYKNKWCCLY